MELEDKANTINEHLTQMGYKPKVDTDFDILFHAEGNLFIISFDNDDEYYYSIFAYIGPSGKSRREKAKSLELCNDISAKIKVVKAYILEGSIVLKTESFHNTLDDFTKIIQKSIKTLIIAISLIKEKDGEALKSLES
jgi:hypothetical protein